MMFETKICLKMKLRTDVLALFAICFVSVIIIMNMESILHLQNIFPLTLSQLTSFGKNETFKSRSLLINETRDDNTITNGSLSSSIEWMSTSAKITFNYDINVTCVTTPFVICDDSVSDISPNTNQSFGIGLLRKTQWFSAVTTFSFSKCQYSNCYFQNNMINESTHMVFLEINGMSDTFKPVPRWSNQLYIALNWESPLNTKAPFLSDRNSTWNKAFNLTATYRTDSDIFVPYSKLRFQQNKKPPNYYEIAKRKTKWALWLVSNCNVPSRRLEYVKQMQKIIDVDIFGRCDRKCTDKSSFCVGNNFTDYRFYLSFENSLCLDYITEKFFKLFNPNMYIIPVVRGAFQYEKYLPRNTFINSADFSNANQLALYLKGLGEDPLDYSRYLQEKDMYRLDEHSGLHSLGCEACRYLNTKKLNKQISDLRHWLVDDKCYFPKDL